MSPEEIRQDKEVEFYAAGITAWYNTSLEHDKSVFVLSAGGIGLLITLLTTVGVNSACLLGLYIVAIFCFLASLCILLVIFRRNRTHIEQVLSGTALQSDPWLERLDIAAIFAFGVGVIFAAVVGISAAVNSPINKKENAMNNEAKTNSLTRVFVGDSFSGVGKLQPQSTAITSVPVPVAPTPEPAPAQASSQPTQGTGK